MNPELQQNIERASRNLHGWCTLEKALALAELILEIIQRKVIEIGVYGGRSLIPMALALHQVGHGKVYGIDPWSNQAALEGDVGKENADWWNTLDLEMIHRSCMSALRAENLEDWAVILRCRSQDCVELFPGCQILHLDGNHSELVSCRDLDLYLPALQADAYLWFDDADWATTSKAGARLDQELTRIKQVGQCLLYQKL